ncbi:MAG TPA: hypothetical protein VHI13_03720 [Candidatus Kapabacteria bacterium]|nr:hypothetical protein [Candidatus Kapabacteria bacterium]
MRQILIATIALLFIAAAAQARVVTLNATVHDSQGNLVTGSHDVTIKVYASATGGSPVWAEFHSSVSFSSGQISLSAGSLSSAGIPDGCFDGSHYFTLSVSGIGITELEPRVNTLDNGATWTGFW